MKVLFVWDQGINYLLTKYLRPLGVESTTVVEEYNDPFGYIPKEWKRKYTGRLTHWKFGVDVLKKTRGCDIIHVHSIDETLPLLNLLNIPIVMHYHGTDIRGRWLDRKKNWKHADKILVATNDLLVGAPAGVTYQPNPIDTELFKPDSNIIPQNAALNFDYGATDIAKLIADWNNLRLVVMQKNNPYTDMPRILNSYTHYIDVKRDWADRVLISRPTDSGSLIGLQTLACGKIVLTLTGKRTELPQEHHPENVARSVYSIYEKVLQKA